MGRKNNVDLDELDKLLIDSQQIRSNNKDFKMSSLPTFTMSKCIMEFAQSFGVIKYRDMRKLLTIFTNCRKIQGDFFQIATKNLSFQPDNWSMLFLNGYRGIDPPGFIPEVFEKDKGMIAKVEEIRDLLETNPEVRAVYDNFLDHWWSMDPISSKISSWIHDQFKLGSLEEKIKAFKEKSEAKKKTNISKGVISNLINPVKAEVIRKTGDLPDLSIGERQALQFLLGKINNMSEREVYLRNKLLDNVEVNPKKDGYFVVFETTDALKKSYGNIRLTGYHYEILEKSLLDLLEKKRKFLIETDKETLEVAITLIQKLELRHKFREEPGFRSFIAAWIPYEIARLHNKKYTSYPEDHFAQLRNTPPKTLLDKTEIRFFDFLRNEAPHEKDEKKIVRRKKEKFLELIGGPESIEHRHQLRLADRIETAYIPKAINMNILESGIVEQNAEREEIYIFEYAVKTN